MDKEDTSTVEIAANGEASAEAAAKDETGVVGAAAGVAESKDSTGANTTSTTTVVVVDEPAASNGNQLGLDAKDIRTILSSTGPVVKCVLLKHVRADGKDAKPHSVDTEEAHDHHHHHHHGRLVLTELIEEIEVDTTPAKDSVTAVLGGPFTFIGQYPTEGTVVMARRDLPADETLETSSVKVLRSLCHDFKVDCTNMLEKSEMIAALKNAQLIVNPHRLQPPFDQMVIRGDILIMKVAETKEELDFDQDDETAAAAPADNLVVPSNDEFFLNYTRDEYIAFASRTDVVAPEINQEDEQLEEDVIHQVEDDEEEGDEDGENNHEDGKDDDDDDDEEDEYKLEDDEDATDEDHLTATMNLILAEVLRKFREDNGRGPDTRELLELRSQVARKLGVDVATFDDIKATEKRELSSDECEHHSNKKVKFTHSVEEINHNDKDQLDGAEETGEAEENES